MDYIFLGLGVLVIAISLFLTYRQENNDGYLDTELLTQFQKLKISIDSLSDNLENKDFKDAFNKEYTLQNLNNNLEELTQKIASLEKNIAELDFTKNNSEDLMANDIKVESEIYQEIKTLKEQGLDTSEIAHKMNLGTREVKLIWKLNSRGEI